MCPSTQVLKKSVYRDDDNLSVVPQCSSCLRRPCRSCCLMMGNAALYATSNQLQRRDASNPIFRMYRIMSWNVKWSSYMKDVEDFIPVYQDTLDPAAEFGTLLSRTGFYIRKCKAVEFSFTFNNQNQLMAALNPFLSRIPLVITIRFPFSSTLTCPAPRRSSLSSCRTACTPWPC